MEKKCEYNGTLHQLTKDSKTCDSVREEVLYKILIGFNIPMKPVMLTKCIETKPIVCIGKNLSDAFRIQNGVKQGDALLPLL